VPSKKEPKTKTLEDVKQDMSELYEEVKNGTTELRTASELANIAGKYLKAEQIKLAREIFAAGLGVKVIAGEEVRRISNASIEE
jgi:hypothetical protein